MMWIHGDPLRAVVGEASRERDQTDYICRHCARLKISASNYMVSRQARRVSMRDGAMLGVYIVHEYMYIYSSRSVAFA